MCDGGGGRWRRRGEEGEGMGKHTQTLNAANVYILHTLYTHNHTQQYDSSRSGMLNFDDVRGVLGDLGLLEGMSASEADTFVIQRFHLSSTVDGVSFDAFCKFYKGLKMSRARHELRSTLGVQSECMGEGWV